MPTFPKSVIQEIKDRLSIVALIGEAVVLRKSGHNHKGLCPFHSEKSPSFMVSEDKQAYHCFGCGEGGDLIAFVMKREGYTFPEAVQMLAERAGVTLPVADAAAGAAETEAARLRKLLLRVNTVAAEYFQSNLFDPAKGTFAREYLTSRGFEKNEFLTQHFLGAADDEWEGLVTHLSARQVPLEYAIMLGLIKEREHGGGSYDFFRGRLMCAIRNARGEVIGFSGRILPSARNAAEAPKYLNSAESPLFNKSESLYGLPMAAQAMRTADRALLVEGNLDVLALHAVGLTETVAPLGTALTAGHLRLLTRFTRNIWVLFDGDTAGQTAAARALPLFLDAGLIPHVVVLPVGEDPDSFVKPDAGKALRDLISQAPTLFEWVIDATVARCGTDTIGRVRAVEQLRALFARLKDPIQEATYQQRLASALQLDVGIITRALRQGGRVVENSMVSPRTPTSPRTLPSAEPIERACLEFILQVPRGMTWLAAHLSVDDFAQPQYRAVAQWCLENFATDGVIVVSRILSGIEDPAEQALVSALAMGTGKFDDEETHEMTARELLARLRRERLQREIAQVESARAVAEHAGNAEEARALQSRFAELQTAKHTNKSFFS